MTDNRSPTNLEDTAFVAYMAYRGHKLKLWYCKEKDVVSFDIEGEQDKIEKDLKGFYNPDEWVEIQEYVKCLKSVKGQMYSFKKTLKSGGLK
jgi:hypothetical protein